MPGFRPFRNDRTGHGGGLLAYVSSTLPARRRQDLEFDLPIESILLETTMNNRKWAVIGVYRPPSVENKLFTDVITKGLDKISVHYDNVMLTGDLNYDCLSESKCSTLNDLCDIFSMKNLIKSPTCYMKNCIPSLVDVILTNQPQYCFNAINFGCGISDWHNMIGIVVKGATARNEKLKMKYRSFKHFDAAQFSTDVSKIPFHAALVFDDVKTGMIFKIQLF